MEEIYLMADENNVFHQVEPIEIIPGRECEALKQAYNMGVNEFSKRMLELLFEVDIPSPTIPEYIEHHEKIQWLMQECKKLAEEMKGTE